MDIDEQMALLDKQSSEGKPKSQQKMAYDLIDAARQMQQAITPGLDQPNPMDYSFKVKQEQGKYILRLAHSSEKERQKTPPLKGEADKRMNETNTRKFFKRM